MNTEITDNKDAYQSGGWVLYDGECPFCINLAQRFTPWLGRHRSALAPLQTPWVRERLGLKPGATLLEMRLHTTDGRVCGGVDARAFLTNWFYKPGYHALTLVFTCFAIVYGWAAPMAGREGLP